MGTVTPLRPRRSATVWHEAHHRGFRVTIRGRAGHQIVHEYGQSERDLVILLRAHGVEERHVEIVPAQR